MYSGPSTFILFHLGEKAMVGLHDYVKRSKLLEEEDVLLPNNTLTLFFKLSLCSTPESEGMVEMASYEKIMVPVSGAICLDI